MTVTVNGQNIYTSDEELIVSESVDIYECEFEFDSTWDGWDKTAKFEGSGVTKEMILIDDKTSIPDEVIKEDGWMRVGVYGTRNAQVMPTIWGADVYVRHGTDPESTEITPTPSIYAQILNLANGAKQKVDELNEDWESVTAEASTLEAGSSASASFDNNKFIFGIPQGPKGNTGAPGAPGATPAFSIGTVTTLETGEPATASITGSAAQPVLNLGLPKGNKGDNGDVTNIAPAYDATATYAVGDYCIHEGQLQRCIVPIETAEAWTASHWTAVAMGEEVDDLRSAIDALNDIVITEYNLSSKTTIGFNIAPSTGKWGSSSNYVCYYFEVPTGAKVAKIKSNATNGTVYALLSASDTHTSGQVPSYATGCTRTFIEAGNEKDIIIPDDCKYIWVTKTLSGTNYAPQFLGFNVSLSKIESEINEISTSNVNLWTGESTISFTKSITVPFSPALPAGTYNLSAVVTSSDADYTYCRASIGGQTVDLTRTTRANNSFTLSAPASSITFYASRNDSYSTGDTATWADIQIEKGIYASNYEPHKMIAYDETARRMVNRIVKYVATTGNDNNDGNTAQTPYATIRKAISETPDIIYVAKGTYTEAQIYENAKLRYSGIKIICDNATLIMPVNGIQFRYANVDISGLTVDVTDASSNSSYGFLLLNCTGEITDCTVIGAKGAGGFRLDGSRVTLTRCVAANCAVDGFNGHTINTGYETEATLIDCIAHDCGDDGASIHESGKMYVIGGEYYNNVQTGLAPHDLCVFEALNVHCHNNGIGIEAVKDTLSTGETPATGRVIGCTLDHNTTYGLDVKNYTVNSLGNAYADNGTGKTRAGTGATINAFTAD